jgi:hypothetical protein
MKSPIEVDSKAVARPALPPHAGLPLLRAAVILRWAARALSLACFLLLCAFFFGGGESMRMTGRQAVVFLLFPVGVVAGFGVSWWREAIGACISLGCLVILYALIFARDGRLHGPYFLLFAVPALLFLAAAWQSGLSKQRR